MLLYRGALVYAEDARGENPIENEVLKHVGHLPQEHNPHVTLSPIVNHGRWIVECPWCFSAQSASRDDHRFFCVECRNIGASGKWASVEWPQSATEIEALLIMRMDPRTRNWRPPETLADLLAENDSHGVL